MPPGNYMKVAVLMTCHNRKEKTRACLSSLFSTLPECAVFLVDDGSTDGTADMVASEFPQVCLLYGDGQLFWSRGMRRAWEESIKGEYEFYLWLNDDVELYPCFLKELIYCQSLMGNKCIISGLVEDSQTKDIIYGGYDKCKQLIGANAVPQPIRYMNGNVVLVSHKVVQAIGIIDSVFHHDLGDVDYGLTAQEHHIGVFTTRIPIASGTRNDYCRIRQWGTNIVQRFKTLYSPLGQHPKINYYYRRKHFGWVNAATYYAYLHIINILPDCLFSKLSGNAYK